ncbi:hypothetical protein L596_018115 [Steinernema carpocapsae]|uniref:Uncharacterized protein n=1 Tax=Steinernema carpocapsae TaxID=34508 RepID=A0A4V6A1Z9_STECR|nr:hypothetical protein L596_018115 [Steinernema carpocapsae]
MTDGGRKEKGTRIQSEGNDLNVDDSANDVDLHEEGGESLGTEGHGNRPEMSRLSNLSLGEALYRTPPLPYPTYVLLSLLLTHPRLLPPFKREISRALRCS